jgi:hypothetical protein
VEILPASCALAPIGFKNGCNCYTVPFLRPKSLALSSTPITPAERILRGTRRPNWRRCRQQPRSTVEVAQARTIGDFYAFFASLAERRINTLATSSDALFLSGHERLIALAALGHHTPTVCPTTKTDRLSR